MQAQHASIIGIEQGVIAGPLLFQSYTVHENELQSKTSVCIDSQPT